MKYVQDLIDTYCGKYLSHNVWFVEEFSKCILNISSIKPKQFTPDSCAAITELISLIKAKPRVWVSESPDISEIESLLACHGHKRYPELEFLEINGMVTADMYKILSVLYYKIRKEDAQNVNKILTYLFSSKQLSLDDITYNEIANIRFAKNDIVWYFWKIVLIFCEIENDPIVTKFVKSNLIIFTTCYQKKSRDIRINIIYHVFKTLCRRKTLYVKHYTVEAKSNNIIQKDVNTTNATSNSNSESDSRFDYLQCFTFKSTTTHKSEDNSVKNAPAPNPSPTIIPVTMST